MKSDSISVYSEVNFLEEIIGESIVDVTLHLDLRRGDETSSFCISTSDEGFLEDIIK